MQKFESVAKVKHASKYVLIIHLRQKLLLQTVRNWLSRLTSNTITKSFLFIQSYKIIMWDENYREGNQNLPILVSKIGMSKKRPTKHDTQTEINKEEMSSFCFNCRALGIDMKPVYEKQSKETNRETFYVAV